MAKITRKTAKIFGETASTAGTDPEIGQFGSAKAGTYVGTGDIDTIQGLSAWSNGWIDAVTPTQQFPTLPEMTGVHKVLSYQTAYLLQEGIPEYDANTTYYINSVCKGLNPDGNLIIYQSKTDNNIGNALNDTANWQQLYGFAADQNLSNLTTTGNNRLHALKGYKDEGELLTDEEGLADVFNYAHSTFDETKFTIVGAPTITDGVASGFSGSDYLTTSQIDRSQAFSQLIKFTTDSTITSGSALICEDTTSTYRSRLIFSSDKLQVLLTSTGSGWNIGTTTGTTTLSGNTTYYVRFSWTGTKYLVDLSTDGVTYSNEITINSSTALRDLACVIGKEVTVAFNGSIDLKYFDIKSNGIIFSGNITGTDTYTIGGNTTTIPYTLSKTGSKIVDSYYRTQVASVYNEFGYAPYYTLSDSDFTLPQGEIYGMMLNQSTPHIISCYENGASGCIVYSNGYCRQWGRVDMSNVLAGSTKTIFLLKEMNPKYNTNNPYFVLNSIYASTHSNEDSPSFILPSSISPTSFSLLKAGGQTGSEFWEVSGYLKDGEY